MDMENVLHRINGLMVDYDVSTSSPTATSFS